MRPSVWLGLARRALGFVSVNQVSVLEKLRVSFSCMNLLFHGKPAVFLRARSGQTGSQLLAAPASPGAFSHLLPAPLLGARPCEGGRGLRPSVLGQHPGWPRGAPLPWGCLQAGGSLA